MCHVKTEGQAFRENAKRKGKNKMKGTQIKVITQRTVTVKAGRAKLREAIKNELAKKGSRAGILIGQLAAERDTVVWNPVRLDEIANELRHLAFQIRNLQNAKAATEEA